MLTFPPQHGMQSTVIFDKVVLHHKTFGKVPTRFAMATMSVLTLLFRGSRNRLQTFDLFIQSTQKIGIGTRIAHSERTGDYTMRSELLDRGATA